MNKFAGCLFTLALTGALAACGGGGGSTGGVTPVVNPSPTVKPSPTTYTVKVKFQGGTSLQSVQSAVRRTESASRVSLVMAHPMDVTANGSLPIEISVQPSPGSQANNDARTFGTATVEVSPMPSPSPGVSVSTTGPAVTVSPLPYASPGATDPPRFNVDAPNVANPTNGTFTASVAAPVGSSTTVPMYWIPRAALACGNRQVFGSDSRVHPGDQTAAIQFVNGVAQAVTSVASADLYIDGPNCSVTGFVNASETDTTIHAPYGAVFVSSVNTEFAALSPTAWSNAITTVTYPTLSSGLQNPTTPTDILLVKTQDGHVVKIAFYDLSNIGSEDLVLTNFAYQEDGFAIDGF